MTSRRLHRILVGVTLAAAVLFGGTPAHASPTLAVPYTPTTDQTNQRVAANAAGDTTAVWRVEEDGATKLKAASRPAGGDWSIPATIASVTTPAAPTEVQPDIQGLVVLPDGVPWVLWQQAELADGVASQLVVSTTAADGSWRIDHTIAAANIGASSALTQAAGNELIVVWSMATQRPTTFGNDSETTPGAVMATQRGSSGAWGDPAPLGAGNGLDAEPTVAANAAGAAVASWRPATDVYEPVPVLWATRTPAGAWTPGPTAVGIRTAGSGLLGPLIDGTGRTHFLPYGAGNYGIASIGHQMAGPGVAVPAKSTVVPEGSKKQSIDGWIGGGYVGGAAPTFDAAGQLVVVTAREANDVESGGYGTGGLYAATRNEAGAWSTVRIDPLAETMDVNDVTVSNDGTGAVVATWAATRGGNGPTCGSLIYRSIRATDGRWAPRELVALAGAAGVPTSFDPATTQGACVAVRPTSTSGAAPLLWWGDRTTFVVTPPASVNGAAPAPAAVPSFTLQTPRWRDVRRAGGVVVGCPAPGEGQCSVSRLLASAKLQGKLYGRRKPPRSVSLRIRALSCLALRQTTSVSGPAGAALLARGPGCSRGWEPPTMSFRLLITYEAVGQRPVAKRITVTIHR